MSIKWIQNATAWQSVQAWRERQAAFRQDFEANAQAINESVTAAHTNQITGTATLISQIVQKRLQQQLANLVNKKV